VSWWWQVVADQVRLWEAETQRARTSPGYFYDQFESLELFERSRDYAKQLGVLLWEHPNSAEHKMYVVTASGESVDRAWPHTSASAPLLSTALLTTVKGVLIKAVCSGARACGRCLAQANSISAVESLRHQMI